VTASVHLQPLTNKPNTAWWPGVASLWARPWPTWP